MPPLPDKEALYPIALPDGSPIKNTVLLANAVDAPNWQIGDYTYASDFDGPEDWASHLAPYLFPFSKGEIHIGKFCQIAHGARFITSSANHAMDGASCYPFAVFDDDRRAGFQPDTRDIDVGHDVWIGYEARIMAGAKIGHGAVIGAGAVVRGVVEPYAIVTGNPGTVVRHRFSAPVVEQLLDLAWWDWPDALIEQAIPAIEACDLTRLQALSKDR